MIDLKQSIHEAIAKAKQNLRDEEEQDRLRFEATKKERHQQEQAALERKKAQEKAQAKAIIEHIPELLKKATKKCVRICDSGDEFGNGFLVAVRQHYWSQYDIQTSIKNINHPVWKLVVQECQNMDIALCVDYHGYTAVDPMSEAGYRSNYFDYFLAIDLTK